MTGNLGRHQFLEHLGNGVARVAQHGHRNEWRPPSRSWAFQIGAKRTWRVPLKCLRWGRCVRPQEISDREGFFAQLSMGNTFLMEDLIGLWNVEREQKLSAVQSAGLVKDLWDPESNVKSALGFRTTPVPPNLTLREKAKAKSKSTKWTYHTWLRDLCHQSKWRQKRWEQSSYRQSFILHIQICSKNVWHLLISSYLQQAILYMYPMI